jgi:class 3 adenylate cyclase/tetratricopeptide (TPR) repeat protein
VSVERAETGARTRLVTLVFTDVEGSTALLSARGETDARRILRACEELIRQQVRNHGGRALKSLGDGLMLTFESPRCAVACALAVQGALTDHARWQPADTVRVRIGIHTGEVTEEAGDVSGSAVHAAARVAARARGGEVLISEVVRHLCADLSNCVFQDRGRVALKGFPGRWRLFRATPTAPGPRLGHGELTPFVGREAERAELRRLMDLACGGHGGLVMIGGEPGVGKTRLCEELAAEAQHRGVLPLVGHCYEGQAELPYMPCVEIVEAAMRTLDPTLLREAMGESAPELARLVPQLRERYPDIPPPLELPPDQQRRYTFTAFSGYVARISRTRPRLYIVEDLHWADESTLLFLEHMAEQLSTMAVLIVGTYRDPPIDISRHLGETLSGLVRRRHARLISLKRHSEPEVAALLQALSGDEPPVTVTAAVYAETEGNAFFVEEVFRHLAETGRLLDERGSFRSDLRFEELDVPENVRLVTAERLDRLSDAAQGQLLRAAVIGRRFGFRLLEAISDLHDEALLDALDEAERARLIFTERSAVQPHYWFAHEITRQTMLGRLSPARRQRCHLRIADAMERLHADEPLRHATDIAYHLFRAGDAADPVRTSRYMIEAGDQAMGAAAYAEALRYYENTLPILRVHDGRGRAELLRRIATAHRSLCRWDDAMLTWDEALTAFSAVVDVEAAAAVCWELGLQLGWAYRVPELLRVAERGIDVVGEGEGRVRMLVLKAIGLAEGGRFEEARPYLDEARRLARGHGQRRLLADVSLAEMWFFYFSMRFEASIEPGRLATEVFREAGALWNLADGLVFVNGALIYCGRFQEFDEVHGELEALADHVGHTAAAAANRRSVFVKMAAQSADLVALDALAEVQERTAREIGNPGWLSYASSLRGILRFWRGDWLRSVTDLEEGVRLAMRAHYFGLQHGFLIMVLSLLGRGDQAGALLDEMREVMPRPGRASTIGGWSLVSLAAEGMGALGDADRARQIYPLVTEALATGTVLRHFDGALLERTAAMAAAAAGLDEQAEEHFEEALRQAEHLPHLMERPQVRHFYAGFLLRRGGRGDVERGRTLLDEALAEYHRIGMPRHAMLARGLGSPPPG